MKNILWVTDGNSELFWILVWRRLGDKPLSESTMTQMVVHLSDAYKNGATSRWVIRSYIWRKLQWRNMLFFLKSNDDLHNLLKIEWRYTPFTWNRMTIYTICSKSNDDITHITRGAKMLIRISCTSKQRSTCAKSLGGVWLRIKMNPWK